MKKEGIVVIAFALLLTISSIQAIQVIGNKTISGKSIGGESVTGESVTGEATTSSFHINISVGPTIENITIIEPENITYDFAVYDLFLLNLSTTSSFAVDTWWFSLYDMNHSDVIYENVTFTPDTTFTTRKWENKLIVYANSSTGNITNEEVHFYVNLNNTAPIISIETDILTCENTYFSHFFYITDFNEYMQSISLKTNEVFYLANYTPDPNDYEFSYKVNYTTWAHELFSDFLNKSTVGGINNGSKKYTRTIIVYDGRYINTKDIDITVIEINHPPNVTNPGVQTIYTQGENSTFYHELSAEDIEDGNASLGNLTFNISFEGENLFNISPYGIINFTANESQIGVENVTICVSDLGLQNPHQNISLCNSTGLNTSSCVNFSLTITDNNRPPNITSYWPLTLSFSVLATNSFYMNITANDPDGTIPDIYWYVDNQQKQYSQGSSFDEFTHSFKCDVSGNHIIRARATDGLEDAIIQWTVNVQNVSCGETPPGGGGGIIEEDCVPKWACGDWGPCRNIKEELAKGTMSGEDYRIAKEICEKEGINEDLCGIKERTCRDINKCDIDGLEKVELKRCLKTYNASCFDGIKNCHDGECEMLIDCGGPCIPCPTCSDGIQNQREEGVDCGGPCPWECEPEKPLPPPSPIYRYSLLILLIILLLYIINKCFRLLEERSNAQKQIIISIFLVTMLILCFVFLYFYSSYRQGDFVYKKEGRIIGEIENSSLTLSHIVKWQDGTQTKEFVLNLGKIKNLEKGEIEKMLEQENTREFSLYSWSASGVAYLETPIRKIEDLKEYTVNLEEDCNPSFVCGPWSECEVDYNLYKQGSLTYGTRYRTCKDSSGCMANFIYAERCQIKKDVLIAKETTPDKDYIEVYNMNNKMVARITRRIEQGIKKLYIEITG